MLKQDAFPRLQVDSTDLTAEVGSSDDEQENTDSQPLLEIALNPALDIHHASFEDTFTVVHVASEQPQIAANDLEDSVDSEGEDVISYASELVPELADTIEPRPSSSVGFIRGIRSLRASQTAALIPAFGPLLLPPWCDYQPVEVA